MNVYDDLGRNGQTSVTRLETSKWLSNFVQLRLNLLLLGFLLYVSMDTTK